MADGVARDLSRVLSGSPAQRLAATDHDLVSERLHEWTQLRWSIDVHIIDNQSPAACTLRRLNEVGWIYLQQADTLITEISGTADVDKFDRLAEAASPYPVMMGPMILNHSVLNLSVLGGPEDEVRLRAVYATLWPNSSYEVDGANTSAKGRTRFRDAMHVATAVRYGLRGFVTLDEPSCPRHPQLPRSSRASRSCHLEKQSG